MIGNEGMTEYEGQEARRRGGGWEQVERKRLKNEKRATGHRWMKARNAGQLDTPDFSSYIEKTTRLELSLSPLSPEIIDASYETSCKMA